MVFVCFFHTTAVRLFFIQQMVYMYGIFNVRTHVGVCCTHELGSDTKKSAQSPLPPSGPLLQLIPLASFVLLSMGVECGLLLPLCKVQAIFSRVDPPPGWEDIKTCYTIMTTTPETLFQDKDVSSQFPRHCWGGYSMLQHLSIQVLWYSNANQK